MAVSDEEKDIKKPNDTPDLDHSEAEIIPPHEMLAQFEGVNVLVRYSKLPFRHLVSQYNCHITTTPMILAKEFSRSAVARRSDFSTNTSERGLFLLTERSSHGSGRQRLVRGSLMAQFAASEALHFADAAELISPYVDGIDLNCGCPQRWAYQEHIGSFLLREPEIVRDIIRSARDRVGANYPFSVKIRVDTDLQKTERLIQTAIHAGVSHIAVHGRTRHQASTAPVSLEAIKFAVEAAKGAVPVVANGDAWSSLEADTIRTATGAQGVMSARGLLANPALFAGYKETPFSAISEFISLSTSYGLQFGLMHRHLAFMLESRFHKHERVLFNQLPSFASVVDYLESRGLDLDSIRTA